jgi:hypothetical protein
MERSTTQAGQSDLEGGKEQGRKDREDHIVFQPCTRKKMIKESNAQITYLPERTGSARKPPPDWGREPRSP